MGLTDVISRRIEPKLAEMIRVRFRFGSPHSVHSGRERTLSKLNSILLNREHSRCIIKLAIRFVGGGGEEAMFE